MSCSEVREQLPGLVYEALEESELARLRSHLEQCSGCQAELTRLRDAFKLLDQEAPEPPRDLVARTLERIDQEPQGSWLGRLGQRLDEWLGRVAAHRPTRASLMGTLTVAVLLLVPVLYPNFLRGRSQGTLTACRTNQRVVTAALDRYADEHQGTYPASLDELSPRYLSRLPRCGPASPAYQRAADGRSFKLSCTDHPFSTPTVSVSPSSPEGHGSSH